MTSGPEEGIHMFPGQREKVPYHFMNPDSTPKYNVPCGLGDKIFGEGHGASIYPHEVTCTKCIAWLIENKLLADRDSAIALAEEQLRKLQRMPKASISGTHDIPYVRVIWGNKSSGIRAEFPAVDVEHAKSIIAAINRE